MSACLVVGVAPAAAGPPSGSGPGNSPNAKLCQKDGWMSVFRSDGTAFGDSSECTSYAAEGGTLTADPLAQASALCGSLGGAFAAGSGSILWFCTDLPSTTSESQLQQLEVRCVADGGVMLAVLDGVETFCF